MTEQEKEELFKDLAERVPYRLKIRLFHDIEKIDDLGEKTIEHYEENSILQGVLCGSEENFVLSETLQFNGLSEVKPYLRPMSSMTAEEESEWLKSLDEETIVSEHSASIDWLLSHHFDYRYLIKRGLALRAIKGMY